MKQHLIIDGKITMKAKLIGMIVGENYTSYFTTRLNRRGKEIIGKSITIGHAVQSHIEIKKVGV